MICIVWNHSTTNRKLPNPRKVAPSGEVACFKLSLRWWRWIIRRGNAQVSCTCTREKKVRMWRSINTRYLFIVGVRLNLPWRSLYHGAKENQARTALVLHVVKSPWMVLERAPRIWRKNALSKLKEKQVCEVPGSKIWRHGGVFWISLSAHCVWVDPFYSFYFFKFF